MMATLMAADAQRIMTVSLKKIVESRTRRGGVCLHRNLLIAGVLFKARDVLLAESASRSNAESCPSRTTTTVAAADDDQSVPVADEPQPMDEGDSGVQSSSSSSSVSSASTFVDTVESSSVEAPSPMMAAADGQSEGKENVPPKEVAVVAAPSACDVKPRAATKRSHSTIVDDVVPAKAARLESDLPATQDRSTTKTVEHAEPEIHCAAAPVSCTSSSSLSTSSDCHASRYHSQSAVKRPDSSSRTSSVHLPVVCLPRVEVKSSCYGMKVRDTMSRPILVMQVV